VYPFLGEILKAYEEIRTMHCACAEVSNRHRLHNPLLVVDVQYGVNKTCFFYGAATQRGSWPPNS